MLKKLFIIIITAQLLTSYTSKAMVNSAESFSIILPGQNGLGGDSFEQNQIVNTPSHATIRFTTLKNPMYIDLGQGNCIQDFEKQLHEPPYKNNKHYFYGISQGTATLLNWLGKMSHEEQEKNVHSLVLESVLGSGDSAILHTIESTILTKIITYLPFTRAWLPLAAKIVAFPTYNPFGKQAVTSAKKISPNIPVIIMHNHADPQLSINDAREVYCSLVENGHNSAYLLEVDSQHQAHLDILDYDIERFKKIAAIQAIYRKHNLPYSKKINITGIDLAKFQPSAKNIREKINNSTGTNRLIRNTIDITATGMLVGYLSYLL
ncbi:MAG: hypothetical protein WC707_05635 [Candidatus Babeliaceae bacterium]|jgi:hypothetical protein